MVLNLKKMKEKKTYQNWKQKTPRKQEPLPPSPLKKSNKTKTNKMHVYLQNWRRKNPTADRSAITENWLNYWFNSSTLESYKHTWCA